MTHSVTTSYRKPGRDLVIRIIDEQASGGPNATLAVGIATHAAQAFDALVRDRLSGHPGSGERDVANESDRMHVSVQRWDQGRRIWRRLDPGEQARFNDTHAGDA